MVRLELFENYKADQRTSMIVDFGNSFITDEKRTYDSFGRLLAIDNGSQKLSYEYNMRGRIIKQRANGVDIVFGYDKIGRLKTKCLGSEQNPISKIEYFYGADNQVAAREVNGVKQQYAYDALGQLLSVSAGGKVLEQYKYDPAGNMLSKTIDGKVTTFKYDASNQLVSSTCNGKAVTYEYDAAGRMIQEGSTSYSYNFANKVVKSGNNTYNYYASGQIANASYAGGEKEDFTWDGLALLERNDTNYLNEPYATGGNPVLAGKDVLFNDMLGTTQGSISKNGKYQATNTTAFGAGNKSAFFTGKPYIEGLGSVFLFRNYRPELGKWQTSDPIGYPDGFNNFAYCNNNATNCFDWLGALTQYGIITEAYLVDATLGGSYSEYEFVDGEYKYTIIYMLSYQRFQQNTWFEASECPDYPHDPAYHIAPEEVDEHYLSGSGPITITTTSETILSFAAIQLIIATSFTNWEEQHEFEFGEYILGKPLSRTVFPSVICQE